MAEAASPLSASDRATMVEAASIWWLFLITGFGNKVILLVVWVGVAALTRGISEIILAFTLRHTRGAI